MYDEKISSLQMAVLMYPAILATAILSVPSITAKYAQHDLWISPILASIFGFATVYIAVRLHQLYPGQSVIDVGRQIGGRMVGKIVGFIFLFFYIQNTGEITRAYGDFIVGSFLFKTPIIVIMSSMVLLCALAVHGGLEVIGRLAQLFFPFLIVLLFIFILCLSPEFQPANMFPILENGVLPPIKGAISPSGWFSEFILIIFLWPFLADKTKGLKYGMFSVFAVMLTLVIVNLAVLFVLGATTSSKVYPLMNVSRYISYGDFFENLESITMAVWITGTFIKISVFYYVSVLITAQLLNLANYHLLVWPLGILIVQFGFWGLPSTMYFSRYDYTAFPFYSLSIQFMIPLLLLVIALLRKRFSASRSNRV